MRTYQQKTAYQLVSSTSFMAILLTGNNEMAFEMRSRILSFKELRSELRFAHRKRLGGHERHSSVYFTQKRVLS